MSRLRVHAAPPAPPQRGLGLVELMLALAIGLFIAIGLVQQFISLRSTERTVATLSQMQDQQRMAMHFLRAAVNNAGSYTVVLDSSLPPPFPQASPFADNQTWVGSGSSASNSTLSVRFRASSGDGLRGCADSLSPDHVYSDTFQIVQDGAGTSYLGCAERDSTLGSSPALRYLVAHVRAMQVRYGVDVEGTGSVSQYLYGDDVAARGLWPNVKTAQVSLEFDNLVSGPGQPATLRLHETFAFMAAN